MLKRYEKRERVPCREHLHTTVLGNGAMFASASLLIKKAIYWMFGNKGQRIIILPVTKSKQPNDFKINTTPNFYGTPLIAS